MEKAKMNKVWLPKAKHHVHLIHHDVIRKGHPKKSFKKSLPAPTLPVDWGNNLSFPILGNDTVGDCMYAAGLHADQTFTGNNGNESSFDAQVVIKDYEILSGGDNGLDEGTLISQWEKGLYNNPEITIFEALDFDPTDATLAQALIYRYGGFIFMLDVPDNWISNFDPAGGTVWDAPASPNPNNGHGVWINGVDKDGRYKAITWGSYVWLTPNGLKKCDPSAFVVTSLRWFDPNGAAPNKLDYNALSNDWQQAGGTTWPSNPFGPTPMPDPTPPGPPTPPEITLTVNITTHTVNVPTGWSKRKKLVPSITIHPGKRIVDIPQNWN